MSTRITEKKFLHIAPRLFTANGTTEGVVTIGDTRGLKVKSTLEIKSNTVPTARFQIKRVISHTQLIVGPICDDMFAVSNMSMYLVSDSASVELPEQKRFIVSSGEVDRATFEEEPTIARRVIQVDELGNPYDAENTLPVNIIPESGIPFTLGSLTLPTLVNQFVSPLDYDQVISYTVGNEETLIFYKNGIAIDELSLTKTPNGWVLDLGFSPTEAFLLLETGSFFELEDNSGFIQLE